VELRGRDRRALRVQLRARNHRHLLLDPLGHETSDRALQGELEPSLDTDLVVVRKSLQKMQDALDALTSQLKHTDAQRRRLFADLTHELATPTATILAISDALENVRGDGPEHTKMVSFLEHEASRLERLVRDMRDLARLDDPDMALERELLDVGALAREAGARSGAMATDLARVEVDATEAFANVDRVRIDQVLANLIGNARRYTKPEGRIVVSVAKADAMVRITVDDDGVGVPDEMLSRLGERLLRIDPSRSTKTGGHGLGLSIVSAVVHRHGGTLRFERAPIGGLRIDICLPGC
jgi:signal transduction histidine kinase